MAWGVPTLGRALRGNEISASSINATWSLGSQNANVGEVVFVFVACDNVSTTDGNTNDVTSVTDSVGNTYTKAREFTNGQGAAAAGATVALFYTVVTTQIVANSTIITVNFSTNIVAKCFYARRFTIGAGNTITVAGTPQDEAHDNVDAGSLTVGGLSSQEYLWLRVIATETDVDGITTLTSGFSDWRDTNVISGSGGGEKGHISLQGEYRIATATTQTSNPTLSDTTVDGANFFIAFKEVASGTTYTQTLTETITFTDVLIRQAGKALLETITHTDTLKRDTSVTKSETLTLTDTVIKQTTKPLRDTITLTDVLTTARIYLIELLETLSLTDALSKLVGWIRSEDFTLTDTVNKSISKTYSETATLTDALTKQAYKSLTETINHTDLIAKQTVKVMTETVTHTDTLNKSTSTTKAETLTLTDTVNKQTGKTLTETINLIDSIVTAIVATATKLKRLLMKIGK